MPLPSGLWLRHPIPTTTDITFLNSVQLRHPIFIDHLCTVVLRTFYGKLFPPHALDAFKCDQTVLTFDSENEFRVFRFHFLLFKMSFIPDCITDCSISTDLIESSFHSQPLSHVNVNPDSVLLTNIDILVSDLSATAV